MHLHLTGPTPPSRPRAVRSRAFRSLLCGAVLGSTGSASAEAPTYRFVEVRTMNGPCCTDEGTDLVVDDEGGVLISGYRGSIDLDHDGRIDIPTFGRPDALLSKVIPLDRNDRRGWTRGPGGPQLDRADAIASDQDGGAYVVGRFTVHLQMAETLKLDSRGGASDGFVSR